MKTYNLFFSHSWNYGAQYSSVVSLLSNRSFFSFRNYSVPSHNPIVGARTDAQLSAAIENKIRASSVVIIMAGVYSTYSKWINKEIEIAKKLGKPIIAVKPFGSTKISSPVRAAANEVCNWSTESIVSAIRRWA
ncbi:TIR domain-containing protein [Vibrio parahaemolyticus]|uniref:TIR domain-containing protein n=1 Tax=Vibrio kanaloae TaxID=170673 RepID=A0A4U1ZME9_9VIBR|nr:MULTISPECIES: TIR domain-containing protein [Vibrio]HDY7661096.1 TIR domain-containing protein [Vibrio vulnificus]EIA1617532.1 TIR domain-containing protein [Vibrio parahaemolyticus]EJG1722104.1 TIR domain-containing protein [Vibrio parahaemolyticus]EJG1736695.1 TIR domain-containing protein [Vibrio parahaemolyticus]EJG1749925.1 TIR domain-containing protein [Vibrio parahaemolyticus]